MLQHLLTKANGLIAILVGLMAGFVGIFSFPHILGWGLVLLALLLLVGGSYAVGAAVSPAGKHGASFSWVGMALALVVVVGSFAAWTFYLNPTHSFSPFFSRHTLPSNVQLPANVTFVSYAASGSPLTEEMNVWVWTSTVSPTEVWRLYSTQLESHGWSSPRAWAQSPDDLLVQAEGPYSFLTIEAQSQSAAAVPPAGGSVVIIRISQIGEAVPPG